MKSERLTLAFLGLHPDRRRDLVARYGHARGVIDAVRRGRIEGIDVAALMTARQQSDSMKRCGVRPLFLGEDEYPTSLAGIADPPDVLFVRGRLPTGPCVAVVGTRRSTAYGRGLARAFGRSIAAAGWVLCSGLARGIDGEAHRGTLDGGGLGVGVLGCGSDVVYPREHEGLITALATRGAIVTEYPPGTPPHGWRFPPRNRIISGLSRVVVVVEATATGGALVTAARAAEQGREVFAVPGDVDRDSSLGCNLLIRDGAIPVLGAADLIEALSLVVGPPAPVHPTGEQEIPASGISTDDLAVRLGLGGAALLSWLGRREVSGQLRIEGDQVFPGLH